MKFDYSGLFEKMVELGMNKGDLTKKAKISTNQMAKLGKGEGVQLETLVKVCDTLNCGIETVKVER